MSKSVKINRKPWLDALRALAIILVVFGHEVQWWEEYFVYTSPIKIPLFFIISGYLFNIKDGDAKLFFMGLFNRIVLPYVALGLISAIVSIPFSGIQSFPVNCLKILSGESYWFMPCLIVGETILFFIIKYTSNIIISAIISTITFVLGSFFVKHEFLNFEMLNITLQIQMFIFLGTLFRRYDEYFAKVPPIMLCFFLVTYILLCCYADCSSLAAGFDPHLGNYSFLPYTLLVIILGNVTLFGLASKIRHWPRFLLFIGQNTLVLYLWANWGKILLFGLMHILHITKPVHSIYFALVCMLSSILFCSICSMVLNKHMPMIVGKK